METYQIVIIAIAIAFVGLVVWGTAYVEWKKSAPKRLEQNIIKAAQKKEMYEVKERHRKELERGYR